jgi:hypothetical protein
MRASTVVRVGPAAFWPLAHFLQNEPNGEFLNDNSGITIGTRQEHETKRVWARLDARAGTRYKVGYK